MPCPTLAPATGVLFDLDSTLVDHLATVRRVAAGQAQALRGLLPAHLHPRFTDRLVELESLRYISRTNIYRQLVHELQLDAGHCRLGPRRLTKEFERHYLSLLVARSDAHGTLALLRQRGMRLGVVCEGKAEALAAKVAALGLDGLLDAFVVPAAAATRGPDPDTLRHAASRLGCPAAQTLHVGGRRLRQDVKAPRLAGLQAAWLKQPGSSVPPVDFVLNQLSDLLDAVPALGNGPQH